MGTTSLQLAQVRNLAAQQSAGEISQTAVNVAVIEVLAALVTRVAPEAEAAPLPEPEDAP